MSVASPGCYLYFWPIGSKSEVPTTPKLGFIDLRERLTVLKETCLHTRLMAYYKKKKINSGTAIWKSCIGQVAGKGQGASMPSLSLPFCLHLHVFTNLETLCALSFWGFMKASLYRIDWRNHWPLAFDLTSSPSPFPRGQKWNWKFQLSKLRVSSPDEESSSSGEFQRLPH